MASIKALKKEINYQRSERIRLIKALNEVSALILEQQAACSSSKQMDRSNSSPRISLSNLRESIRREVKTSDTAGSSDAARGRRRRSMVPVVLN